MQWLRRKDKQVRTLHRHSRSKGSGAKQWCFRSKGSGAKQFSGFGGKISKSELCTGTAEQVLHLLSFGSETQVQSIAVVSKEI